MDRKLVLFSLFMFLFLFCLPNVFSNTYYWVQNSSIVTGLGDVGAYSSPTIFNDNGNLKLIAGNSSGNFSGFQWNGTSWVQNSSIVLGLNYHGQFASPTIFNDNITWKLISGNYWGNFSGFQWNGTSWVQNSSIVTGLGDVGVESKPTIFNDNSTWKLISGSYTEGFSGFQWNGTSWVQNSSIVTGLNVIQFASPTIFNDNGIWKLISGEYSQYTFGNFSGFQWNGTSWVQNSSIVTGLGDTFEAKSPFVFNESNIFKLISGDKNGLFYGFKLNLIPSIIINYPLQNQTFNSSITIITLNWTSYDNEPVTDVVYLNNGSGYYQYYSQTHNPGNYSESLNVISDTTYFWYVNTSDGLNTTKSEIRNFTIELNPPTIYNISALPNPVEIGENITLNATIVLGDNPISVVWATIWQGATIIWTGILNFVSGTLYSIIVPTNVTFSGVNNYTIYTNDTLGNNATSVSGNFTASANPPNITLNSPNNSQIFKSVNSVTLNWTSGDDGASVNDSVYVYNSTNWNVVYSASHTPGIYTYVLSVLNGTVYQWYVTTNDGTSTIQSETRNFTNSFSCVGTTFNFICGDNINQSCIFNGNLNSAGNCFNITKNSTTVDCDNKLLNGNTSGIGINAYLNLQNITIKDCIIGYFNNNILFSSSNGTIENSTLKNSINNTLVLVGNNNTINKTIYQQNNYGVLVNGSNNKFYSTFINYTYYDGIKFTSTVTGNSLLDSIICLNNRVGGSYYDYYDLDSTSETNTTCDTSNPGGICDYACTGGSLEPSVVLNSPTNNTIFPDITTTVNLNWTSNYYTGNVTDIVYLNNGSGYYILSNETHTPGTYNKSFVVSNSINYSWYVNTSVGSKINQSEIWIFSIQDSINPVINSVSDYPDPQASYWNVTINASITNNTFPIDKATVRVENPLGNIIYTNNLSLIGGRWINKITTNDGFLGTNYYFVNANNTIGGVSNTLNSTFTINNPSPSIILNSPSDGYSYSNGTTTVTLNFTSVDNNPTVIDTIFLLNESDDVIVYNTATHSPGTYTFVVNVTNGRTYKWYVVSDDTYSNSTTSATRTFSVGSATIGCVGATTTFICGQNITESCTMNGDLNSTFGCFDVNSDNIIIDCNNHILTRPTGVTFDSGINLQNRNNITIQNCIISKYYVGISSTLSSNIRLINNSIYNNSGFGIWSNAIINSFIQNNTLRYNNHGIYFQTPGYAINSNITLSKNNITNNFGYGAYFSNFVNSSITDLFSFYNNLTGIYFTSSSSNNNLQNSVACYNTNISGLLNCYQETANVSTACGGLSTGNYLVVANYLYINYTKPTNALNISNWQIKHGNLSTFNVSLPNSCFVQSKLMFRMYSNTPPTSGYGEHGSTAECYNGSNWVSLSNLSLLQSVSSSFLENPNEMFDGNWNTGSAYTPYQYYWENYTNILATIYEEAMWWILNETTYSSGYDYYDLDSNTETNTTCDTSSPTGICDIYCNGTIINPVNPNNTTIVLNSPATGASYPDTTLEVTLNFTSNSSLTTLLDSIYVNSGSGYTLVYQQSHSKGTYTYNYPITVAGTYLWYATTNDSTHTATTSIRNFTISGTSYPLVTLISPADDSIFNYMTRQVQLKWNCYDPYFSTLTNRLYVNGNLVYSASLAPGNRTYILNTSEGASYTWYVSCQSPIRTTTSAIRDFTITTRSGFECTTDFLGLCTIIKEISIGTNNIFHYWWLGLFVILIAIVLMGALIVLGAIIARKIKGE